MDRVRLSVWMLGITFLMGAALLLSPWMGERLLPAPAEVVLTEVTLGSIEQTMAVTGQVRYAAEYAALSPASGVVAQVCVEPGMRVKAGQPLFRLEGAAQETALTILIASQPAGEEAAALHHQQALMEASAQLEGLTVRAPTDGQVHRISITEHGGVQAGSEAVLLSSGIQQIVCAVTMSDAARIRAGMQARLSVQEKPLGGACVAVVGALETDAVTGTPMVQVFLEPEQPLPFPLGTSVDVEIVLLRRNNVPVIPLEALTASGTVWWAADGCCYEVEAGVQLTDAASAWVALPVGMSLVIGEGLAQGQRYRAVQRKVN